jgi:hypothetical protein
MAIEIEANISSPKEEHLSTPEIKVDYPEDTSDIPNLDDMATLKIFVRRFNEWWESVGKQGFEERNPNEGYQSHEEEKNLLMLLPRIMRTWLKSKSLKISNMMMKY